jgi:hypothetical protein
MTSILVTIIMGLGILFAGFLGGYVVAEQTYSPKNLMMNDSQTTTQWMQTMMDTMMNDPELQQQMMNQMMQNSQFMQNMMNIRMNSSMLKSDMVDNSMMSDMSFNVDAPITIPMIDAYYNGERVYFIHTEISDASMAQMMSMMVNFPTLHVSELQKIPQDDLANIYVFTNGVPGMGPYGGGPFMYQIDIFDSIPGESSYSQFRNPHLVTWNEGANPRVLTSIEQLLDAEKNGELTIQPTENVVNVPMIVWKDNDQQQTAIMIPRIFTSMPDVEGEVLMADTDMYFVRMNLRSPNQMNMMN